MLGAADTPTSRMGTQSQGWCRGQAPTLRPVPPAWPSSEKQPPVPAARASAARAVQAHSEAYKAILWPELLLAPVGQATQGQGPTRTQGPDPALVSITPGEARTRCPGQEQQAAQQLGCACAQETSWFCG